MEDTIRRELSEKLKEKYGSRVGYPLPIIEERFGKELVDIVLTQDDAEAWNVAECRLDGNFYRNLDDFIDKQYEFLCECLMPKVVIRFPEVEIRNERGEHRTLKDIYIALNIVGGKLFGTFCLIRTTYACAEFNSGYIHSHVHPFQFHIWQTPCLGRGPISNTISSLSIADEPNLWMLFLEELRMFVETESVQGVPYIYMASITNGTSCKIDPLIMFPLTSPRRYRKEALQALCPLLEEYLSNMNMSLTTDVSENTFYFPSDSIIMFWEKLSGMVKDKLGEDNPVLEGLMRRYVLNDKGWFSVNNRSSRTEGMEGKELFTFKGETRKITVIKDDRQEGEMMLDISVARAIYSFIMLKINLIGYETRRITERHFVF